MPQLFIILSILLFLTVLIYVNLKEWNKDKKPDADPQQEFSAWNVSLALGIGVPLSVSAVTASSDSTGLYGLIFSLVAAFAIPTFIDGYNHRKRIKNYTEIATKSKKYPVVKILLFFHWATIFYWFGIGIAIYKIYSLREHFNL